MLFLLCNYSMKFNHSSWAVLPGLNVAKLPGEGGGLHSKQCLPGTHRAPATLSDLENLLPCLGAPFWSNLIWAEVISQWGDSCILLWINWCFNKYYQSHTQGLFNLSVLWVWGRNKLLYLWCLSTLVCSSAGQVYWKEGHTQAWIGAALCRCEGSCAD